MNFHDIKLPNIPGWSPVCFDNDRQEHVYFISAVIDGSTLIKIGRTYDLKKRQWQIRYDLGPKLNLLGSVNLVGSPNSSSLEKHLHKMFSETRVKGEWFSESPELLSLIEDVNNGQK